MKYELTPTEKKQINDGEIVTFAAYSPQAAALCQYTAEHTGIKYKSEVSQSPTGKRIFVFFLYPTTFHKAFRAGCMLDRPDLYNSESEHLLPQWIDKFKTLTP